METKKNYTGAFITVTTLFFLWGFITVLVDSLVPRLREVFELSYFQAGLVQFAFFIAYFVFSLPAGAMISKIGYKRGIIVGLVTMALGCLLFYPASSARLFPIFMLAYFTLAAGITILQVAANPYVAVLGEEAKAGSRLNLAQAFNSLGTAIAPLIGASYLLSDKILNSDEINVLSTTAKQQYYSGEASAVQGPFLFFAGIIFLLAIIFVFIKLPSILHKEETGSLKDVIKKPAVLMGSLGIFVYVGAEVALGSYLINYFLSFNLDQLIINNSGMNSIASTLLGKSTAGVDPKAIVGAFILFYWSGAMIGRFLGSFIMQFVKSSKVLLFFGLGAVLMIILSLSTEGFVAMWAILAVGLFNSIMFPTIFTLTLDGLGDLKPQASGLLCMAIVGGAIIPSTFGALIDTSGFTVALILPILCYLYITYFAWTKRAV